MPAKPLVEASVHPIRSSAPLKPLPGSSRVVLAPSVGLALVLLGSSCSDAHSQPPAELPANFEVTVLLPSGAAGPPMFMELYRGPEPGDWVATAGTPGKVQHKLSIVLPQTGGPWLLRVDSRPAGVGSYSLSLHRVGTTPPGRFLAASPDRYEGDDSWFQATRLQSGEVQAHSLGPSSNPRGDEDWFVLDPQESPEAPGGKR
jgi:hypothetical protein